MGATVRQVAERAGVAVSTASNVLNGKERLFPISDETKARVMAAAEELGYSPGQRRGRRTRKTDTIGCVFAAHLSLISDPILAPVLDGIGSALEEQGYDLLLSGGYESIDERLLYAADKRKVDGLLYFIYTTTYDDFQQKLAREPDAPTVPVMGMQFFERHRGGRAVGLRARRASALAVTHLRGLGHDAIGFVAGGPRRMLTMQEMGQGFTEAVADHRVGRSRLFEAEDLERADLVPHHVADHYAYGRAVAEQLHARGELLGAYVVTNDLAAAGFRDALADHGRRVPEDVALVGMGNLLDTATGSDFLTTVDTKRREIGRTAAERLLALLAGEDGAEEFVALDPELVVRRSCGA